ncbi:hypothetical protein C8Q80DRAFT_1167970 [Daedaleopsis nitida]|nr:hypothetical protein C8Q80DRAFT_1167970 [Daedaleopsis nitida]
MDVSSATTRPTSTSAVPLRRSLPYIIYSPSSPPTLLSHPHHLPLSQRTASDDCQLSKVPPRSTRPSFMAPKLAHASETAGLFYPRLGVSSPFDARHDFVTSPVFSPLVLALVRLTLGTYALVVLLYHLIYEAVKTHDVDGFFSYFTHLSYIGLIAYLYASGVQTLVYAVTRRKSYPLQRWPRPLQFLHYLLYSTITTYPIVVTVIFWALLADAETLSTKFNAFTNISEHMMNTVFAVVEVTLTNASPSPWLHLPICVFMLACYLGVAYITNATQGFYTYSFLDPEKQDAKLAGYIVGIAAAECLAFLLVRGLTWLRMKLSKRNSSTLPDGTEDGRPSEEWEEVERPTSSIAHAV